MFLITVLASIYRYLLLPAVCLFSAVVHGLLWLAFSSSRSPMSSPLPLLQPTGGKSQHQAGHSGLLLEAGSDLHEFILNRLVQNLVAETWLR